MKHGLHIFPNVFVAFLGSKVASRRSRQQKTHSGTYSFSVYFTDTFCKMCTAPTPQAPTRSGGLNNNILLVIREFNNHFIHGPPRSLPTRSSSRRGLLPPLRGGNWKCKESPVLPIPSYPALCREDTTSWNDGRPRTHFQESPREPGRTQESPGELMRAHESPGEPRRAQESPIVPRRPQESPGESRRAKETTGDHRRAQETTEEPRSRRAQESPGEPRRALQVTSCAMMP